MTSNKVRAVGVIGAGSFGTAVANLLAKNIRVYVYARDPKVVESMVETRMLRNTKLNDNIIPTHDLELICKECSILFPVIPSANMRMLIRSMSSYLRPYHILIHGTKGLDIKLKDNLTLNDVKTIRRENIRTISEVIREESVVLRVGCLAGPNLSKELLSGQPAATVVASHFKEVITLGQKYLRNDHFQVYGNNDLIGIELAGVLKNIIAIAAGALHGLGLGENAKGLLISRGMIEIIYLGRALGGDPEAFLGLAGIGDLVATCNSTLSRNFNVGQRLSKGENLDQIVNSMDEVAEGINTVKLMTKLAHTYRVRAPITETLYKIMEQEMTVKEGLDYLMAYPMNVDIGFLKTELNHH